MKDTAAQAGEAHEALCNNCGKCCYKKVIIGRSVFITPFPCEYLNIQTNLCTIYDRRHELNPTCLTVEDGLKASAFPSECGYVKELAPKNYRPAREDFDLESEWHDFDGLADDLEVDEPLREMIRARGPHAPPMYVEVNQRMERERGAKPGSAANEPAAEAALFWGATVKHVNLSHTENEAPPTLVDLLKEVEEAKRRAKECSGDTVAAK